MKSGGLGLERKERNIIISLVWIKKEEERKVNSINLCFDRISW